MGNRGRDHVRQTGSPELYKHSKKCLESPRAGRKKEGSPLELSQGWGPVHTLMSAFKPSRTVKISTAVVSSHQVDAHLFIRAQEIPQTDSKPNSGNGLGHNKGLALSWGGVKISKTRES